jgi:hypothetical protein
MAKTKTAPEPEQEPVTLTHNEMPDEPKPEPKRFNHAHYANVLTPTWVCWFQDADASLDPFPALVRSNNGQGILMVDVKVHGNNFRSYTGVRHVRDPELEICSHDAKRNSGGWCLPDEYVALTLAKREAIWIRAEEEREAQIEARRIARERDIEARAQYEAHLAMMSKG